MLTKSIRERGETYNSWCYLLTGEIFYDFSLFLFLALFEMNALMDFKLLWWYATTKLKLKLELKWLEWKLTITETEFISESEI